MPKLNLTIKERLLKDIIIDDNDCWLFKPDKVHGRYSQISIGRKMHSAHRVSYEVFVAPIPEGKILLHSCDNGRCINPAHLKPGTQKDNMDDCKAKGRMNKHNAGTHCKHGHEFTPENTYIRPEGFRQCRKCRNAASTKAHQGKKRL